MKPFLFLCLVAAALSWPFIHFPAHFSYDEGVYLATLGALRTGAKLYEEIYYTQLPLFIRWLDWFSPSPGISVSGLRWVIWSHFPLFLASIGWVAFRLFGPVAATLTMFAATFDPAVIGLSHVVNGNIPAMAWATFSWALALEARKRESFCWVIFSALALAVGVQFKAIALPAIVPIAFCLVDFRQISATLKRGSAFGLGFGAGSVALLFLTGYQLSYFSQLQGGTLATQVAAQSLLDRVGLLWKYAAMVPAGFMGDDANYNYWPLFLAASSVLWMGLIRQRSRGWMAVAVWWSVSVAALLAHRQIWAHHLLLITPSIALAIGAFGAMALAEPKGRLRSAMIFVLAFTFLYSFRFSLEPLREIRVARADWDREVGPILKHIAEKTAERAFILVDQPYFAVVTGRQTYPEVVDPSRVRIKTGSLSCAIMDRLLADPRTEMVLMERRFRTMDCGEPIETKVRKLFPRAQKFALEVTAFTR